MEFNVRVEVGAILVLNVVADNEEEAEQEGGKIADELLETWEADTDGYGFMTNKAAVVYEVEAMEE